MSLLYVYYVKYVSGMARKIPFVFGPFNYDGLTHAQRVCRLYRACLQTVWSYEWKDTDLQRRDMVRIRYLFDKNREVSNLFHVKTYPSSEPLMVRVAEPLNFPHPFYSIIHKFIFQTHI